MGTDYMKKTLHELCALKKVEKLNSTPYHHKTLGTIERSHRTLNQYLKMYISSDKSDWDILLQYFTIAQHKIIAHSNLYMGNAHLSWISLVRIS